MAWIYYYLAKLDRRVLLCLLAKQVWLGDGRIGEFQVRASSNQGIGLGFSSRVVDLRYDNQAAKVLRFCSIIRVHRLSEAVDQGNASI
eukprot:1483042-Amphidinium_carterae.1